MRPSTRDRFPEATKDAFGSGVFFVRKRPVCGTAVMKKSGRRSLGVRLHLQMLRSIYRFITFAAWSPFGPSTMSNSTSSPSVKDLKPSAWIAEKCTNTSSPPSCSMKPKPLASLNHFTRPSATANSPPFYLELNVQANQKRQGPGILILAASLFSTAQETETTSFNIATLHLK